MVALFALLSSKAVMGQSDSLAEYKVKAVFIYKLLRYIEWPVQSPLQTSVDISLCILGDDPFGNSLDIVRGQVIQGRKLQVKRIAPSSPPPDCHVVFFSESVNGEVPRLAANFKAKHALIVGDTTGYARQGVMLNFYLEQGKVLFEVNLYSLNNAGLTISSKLLKLARIVRT